MFRLLGVCFWLRNWVWVSGLGFRNWAADWPPWMPFGSDSTYTSTIQLASCMYGNQTKLRKPRQPCVFRRLRDHVKLCNQLPPFAQRPCPLHFGSVSRALPGRLGSESAFERRKKMLATASASRLNCTATVFINDRETVH